MDRNLQQDSHRPAGQIHPFSSRDTVAIPRKDRFAYWRDLFIGSFIDRDRSLRASDFRGEIVSSVVPNGVTFSNLRADPLICTFGKRDSGLVLLGMVRQGAVGVRQGNDETAVMDARSGLILFDCDRPAVTSSTRYDLTYLALPRSVVTAAMGADPLPRGMAMRFLPNQGLAPILHAHLEAMSSHGLHLAPAESLAAMRAASDMALTLLSRLHPRGIADGEALDEALFTSARRFIEMNLARYD